MRRFTTTVILAAGIVLLSFTGCGDDDKGTGPTAGVYAEFYFHKWVNSIVPPSPSASDNITVRLDSVYAPDSALQPIGLAVITLLDDTLFYGPSLVYSYRCVHICDFLEPGEDYTFSIEANEGIPGLTKTIALPNTKPIITYPRWGEYHRIGDDLQVTWINSGPGEVNIKIVQYPDTLCSVNIPNSGAAVIPWETIATAQADDAHIFMEHRIRSSLNASGYDSRSFIETRIHTNLYLKLYD